MKENDLRVRFFYPKAQEIQKLNKKSILSGSFIQDASNSDSWDSREQNMGSSTFVSTNDTRHTKHKNFKLREVNYLVIEI